MKRPTQTVFIRENNKTYAFDAVIKIEAQTSLKIAEEESDVKGKTHVNYAVKQPNKVQMEVSVSDTVTVSNEPLTKGSGQRSLLAHQCLIAMQGRRNLLTLITPSYTFTKMLIEGIVQEANDDYQDGEFHATITFKEMTVVPKKTYPAKPIEENVTFRQEDQPDKSLYAQGYDKIKEAVGNIFGSPSKNSTKGQALVISYTK